MPKNKYSADIRRMYRNAYLAGRRAERQFMWDTICIALNHKHGWGAELLEQLGAESAIIHDEYAEAWNEECAGSIDHTADGVKGLMDRVLQQIFGEKFQPWERRYEE